MISADQQILKPACQIYLFFKDFNVIIKCAFSSLLRVLGGWEDAPCFSPPSCRMQDGGADESYMSSVKQQQLKTDNNHIKYKKKTDFQVHAADKTANQFTC